MMMTMRNGKMVKITDEEGRRVQLKAVMKKAWEIKKLDKRNVFAECLKMAWAFVKRNAKRISIKAWFQDKLGKENHAYIMNWNDTPVRETEKAVLVAIEFESFYGTEFEKNCWIPKSCLV